MLHTDQISVARHLGSGKIGLEKESLRITKEGFMTQTRDQCYLGMECLDKCTKRIRETLLGMTSRP